MVNKRTMDAEGLETALVTLGYSVRGLSHFLGVNESTIFRWIKSDHVPRAVAMLLQVMIAKQLTANDVLTIADVRPSQREFILAHLHDKRMPENRD